MARSDSSSYTFHGPRRVVLFVGRVCQFVRLHVCMSGHLAHLALFDFDEIWYTCVSLNLAGNNVEIFPRFFSTIAMAMAKPFKYDIFNLRTPFFTN